MGDIDTPCITTEWSSRERFAEPSLALLFMHFQSRRKIIFGMTTEQAFELQAEDTETSLRRPLVYLTHRLEQRC
jgi:hypothetical protein